VQGGAIACERRVVWGKGVSPCSPSARITTIFGGRATARTLQRTVQRKMRAHDRQDGAEDGAEEDAPTMFATVKRMGRRHDDTRHDTDTVACLFPPEFTGQLGRARLLLHFLL
jgi:hypothetical protein